MALSEALLSSAARTIGRDLSPMRVAVCVCRSALTAFVMRAPVSLLALLLVVLLSAASAALVPRRILLDDVSTCQRKCVMAMLLVWPSVHICLMISLMTRPSRYPAHDRS
jgi:hypothetical protein